MKRSSGGDLRSESAVIVFNDSFDLCFPILESTVQMLDKQVVNNNFYCDFQRNCEEIDQAEPMAPELPARPRIHTSAAYNEGLGELATS